MREEDTVCVGSDGLQYCKVCGEAQEAGERGQGRERS